MYATAQPARNTWKARSELQLEHDEFRSGLKLVWPDNKNIENNPMQSSRWAATSYRERPTECEKPI